MYFPIYILKFKLKFSVRRSEQFSVQTQAQIVKKSVENCTILRNSFVQITRPCCRLKPIGAYFLRKIIHRLSNSLTMFEFMKLKPETTREKIFFSPIVRILSVLNKDGFTNKE